MSSSWLSDSSLLSRAAAGLRRELSASLSVARLHVRSWVDIHNARYYDRVFDMALQTLTGQHTSAYVSIRQHTSAYVSVFDMALQTLTGLLSYDVC